MFGYFDPYLLYFFSLSKPKIFVSDDLVQSSCVAYVKYYCMLSALLMDFLTPLFAICFSSKIHDTHPILMTCKHT